MLNAADNVNLHEQMKNIPNLAKLVYKIHRNVVCKCELRPINNIYINSSETDHTHNLNVTFQYLIILKFLKLFLH